MSSSSKRSGGRKKGVGAQGPSRRARLNQVRAAQLRKERERRLVITAAIVLAAALVIGGVVWLVVDSNRTKQGDDQFPVVEIRQDPADATAIRFAGAESSDGSLPAEVPDGVRHVELYADFHCPACVNFEAGFGPILREAESKGTAVVDVWMMAFIDQGSVNAANAFGCAASQGFGRAYFDALFANSSRQWTQAQLIALPGEIDQSANEEFTTCVNEGQNLNWVTSITQAADQRGVSSTPTLFIDGEEVDRSAMTEEQLRAMLGL